MQPKQVPLKAEGRRLDPRAQDKKPRNRVGIKEVRNTMKIINCRV